MWSASALPMPSGEPLEFFSVRMSVIYKDNRP
jgi:hypothetical protein